jgi:bicarbonate transport system permease protein
MTTASRRLAANGSENALVSSLKKQLPNILPPLVAIAIFLLIWQIFSLTPGATLPGPIQVVKDTWILIGWPFYDKGGIDKAYFGKCLPVYNESRSVTH